MSSSTAAASTSSTAIKHRQMAHLAQQFQVLASRAEQLERLTVTTAEQAYYIRLLGGYHASWFVSLIWVSAWYFVDGTREDSKLILVFRFLLFDFPYSN